MLLRRADHRDLEEQWRAEISDLEGLADLQITGQVPVLDLRALAGSADEATDGELGLPRAQPPMGGPVILPATDAIQAVVAFRRAAVSLALREQASEPARRYSLLCAESLLGLAAGGHEAELSAILVADPAFSGATWTVACYQIGDLSPSTLRDFPSAALAVMTLARCESEAHVAAELIVSNGEGVRWTALVRSGAEVVYQPLAPSTASAASPTELLGARHRWEDQLLMWAACPTDGLNPRPVQQAASVGEPPPHDLAAPRPVLAAAIADLGVDPAVAGASDPTLVGVVLGQVLEKVRAIESRVAEPAAAAPAPAAEEETDGRVAELQSQLDSLRSEVALLRTENSSIRFESSSLRTENSSLRHENSSLRSEHTALRAELFTALTESRVPPAPRRQTPRSLDVGARSAVAADERIVVVPSEARG